MVDASQPLQMPCKTQNVVTSSMCKMAGHDLRQYYPCRHQCTSLKYTKYSNWSTALAFIHVHDK